MMKQNGFTLMELIMVLVISVLLITVAVPGMYSFIVSSQRSSAAMEFYSDLSLARSEAISRNQRITVCKSSDGITCLATGSGSWEDGWIIYVNKDNTTDTTEPDTDADPNINEDIVRVNDGLSTGFTLSSEASDELRRSISFLSSGRTITPGALRLCTNATEITDRRVVVSPSGRIEILEQDCP